MNKLFFEVNEPKPSEMPAGASPTPLPVRFLKFRSDKRLNSIKIVALAEAANFRRGPHKSSGLTELNLFRLIYDIFMEFSFYLSAKLKRCGLRHHEFKVSLWVWLDFTFLSFWGATRRRISITTICVIAILQLRFRMTMRCYHKWLLSIFPNPYFLISNHYMRRWQFCHKSSLNQAQ